MKRSFLILLAINILFSSCHEMVEIEKPSGERIICCEKAPRLDGTVMLKLVDSRGNWSNTIDFNKLDLLRKDNNWNNIPKEPRESLVKIVKKNTDTTYIDGIKVTFANWTNFGKDFHFFKLKRNENTEDKIIAFYEDMSKECNCVGKKLIKILYNGKEYKVNNENLDDGDHEKDFVVTPIDILVE